MFNEKHNLLVLRLKNLQLTAIGSRLERKWLLLSDALYVKKNHHVKERCTCVGKVHKSMYVSKKALTYYVAI